MKRLHVDSGILGDASASRAVTREIVARWMKAVPGIEVEHLDLAQRQVPASRDAQILADFLAADVAFIGLTDLTFVRAEGLAISLQHRQKALDAALAAIPVAKAA